MANVAAVVTMDHHEPGVRHVLWETMAKGDVGIGTDAGTGDNLGMSAFADRTVTVTGTFDGETLTMQGSLDASNWFTLTDQVGADLTFTAAGMKMVAELVRYIRPSLSGSGAGSDIDVRMIARSSSTKLQ